MPRLLSLSRYPQFFLPLGAFILTAMVPVQALEFMEVAGAIAPERAHYLIESLNKAELWKSPRAIPQNVDWLVLPETGLRLGFRDDVIWLHLAAKNTSTKTDTWMWRFNNNRLYDLTFFAETEAGVLESSLSGAQVTRKKQKTPCNGFCYSFIIKPAETKNFFIRIQSNTTLRINPKLYREVEYREAEATNDIFLGRHWGIDWRTRRTKETL